jgi:hypothetical protein
MRKEVLGIGIAYNLVALTIRLFGMIGVQHSLRSFH